MITNESPTPCYKNSFHFSKALWVALCVILLCWLFLYAILGHYSDSDRLAYDQLMQGDSSGNKTIEAQVSKQQRIGLQKNIFFNHDNQRLELRLNSARSELALEKSDRHIDIVEHLQEVTCSLQERVYFVLKDGRQAFSRGEGMLWIEGTHPDDFASLIPENTTGLLKEQVVLVLKAKDAVYHYKGQLLVANKVEVMRYIISSHHLKELPLDAKLISNGIASKVEVSLAGKKWDFKADNVEAKFSMRSFLR